MRDLIDTAHAESWCGILGETTMKSELIKTHIRDAMYKMANNPYGATSQLNTSLAMEKLGMALKGVAELEVELAGKNAVIDELHKDIAYYRKDLKDQMIQDQGLEA